MNHNYKLSDFKMMHGEVDTNIFERMVSIKLKNADELPEALVYRLETMINTLITDHEQEHNVSISLETMEIDMLLEVDTQERTLYLETYIGYNIKEDSLYCKGVIRSDDEDYDSIKKYFLEKLYNFVHERMEKIKNCA